MSTTRTTFTSDDKDILAALQRIQRETLKLKEKNAKLSDQARKNANASQTGFKKTGAAIKATTALTVAMVAAVGRATARVKELRDEAAATQFEVDKMTRGFQVQAGLGQRESIEKRNQILEISTANAVPFEKGVKTAQQLVSSGFKNPVESGTLNAFQKIIASSNAQDEDPEALAKAVGQFLVSFDREKTGKEVLNLGVRIRGLFKETDAQLSALPDFAKAAPVFAGAEQTLENTLSFLTILSDSRSFAEASTQGRNIVSILQASSTTKQVRLLKGIGVDPEQTDLAGEQIPEALATINQALEKQPQAKRALFLNQFFGRENVSGAQVGLNNLDKFPEFNRLQKDTKGFDKSVFDSQRGLAAAKVRLDNDTIRVQLKDEGRAAREALLKQALDNEIARVVNQLEREGKGIQATLFAAGQYLFQDKPIELGLLNPSSVAPERTIRQVDDAQRARTDPDFKELQKEMLAEMKKQNRHLEDQKADRKVQNRRPDNQRPAHQDVEVRPKKPRRVVNPTAHGE